MPDLMDGLDSLIQQVRDEADAKITALEQAKAALGGTPTTGRRTPERARRVSGRKAQVEAVIRDRPGVSAQFIANELKTRTNTVYRAAAELKAEGRVKKDDKSFYPQPKAA